MKKLMFAAAAIAAGVAVADVTSANVVGYQNIVTGSDVGRITTMTFDKIAGVNRTLGEFTPVRVSGTQKFRNNNYTLTFYNASGNQRKVMEDTEIARLWPDALLDSTISNKAVVVAWNPDESAAGPAGWYLANDYSNKKYPLKDYVLSDADGFRVTVAKAFAEGVYLTCSGEVCPEIKTIRIPAGQNTLIGNPTPADVTLGSLTPTRVSGKQAFRNNNFTLTFYDTKGNQRKVCDDTEIKRLWPAAQFDAAISNKAVVVAFVENDGWYLANDYSSKNYKLNNYTLKPGDGFKVYAVTGFTGGLDLHFPTPIKQNVEE